MNHILKESTLIVYLTGVLAMQCDAQGLVNFSNLNTPGNVNAPVFQSDGVTPLSGPQFMAELLGGPNANNLVSVAETGFLTGAASGYFFGGSVAILNVLPGSPAWIQVRVWNTQSGLSFVQAQASGLPNSWWSSTPFNVTTGGGVVNPSPAAPLTGLGNSPVYLNSVPEPATTALLGLGVGVLLLRYRRLK